MVKTLISLLFVLGVALVLQKGLIQKHVPPCSEPLTYFVGTFDRRFGLSYEDFLSALSEAEALWEKPLGLDLFAYSREGGRLTISLIYDYRQSVTEELSQIETVVKSDEATYHNLEAKYESLKVEYSSLKSSYDSLVTLFDEHSAQYEQSVSAWNSGKRTSRSEFEVLQTKRQALEQEASTIKDLEIRLNAKVREINSLVVTLNILVKKLNLNVSDYNTIGASRGDTFTGGVYTSDASGERIDIFEFQNHEKLVRVLAHELGHALGLEHLPDKDAIMYEFNEGSVGKLAQADLDALKTLCGVE